MSTLIRAPLAALDANVSTRATPAQIVAAGLDAAVSTRATPAQVSAALAALNLTAGGVASVKSVQTVEFAIANGTTSGSASISAVVVAKSALIPLGVTNNTNYEAVRFSLASTSVTGTRYDTAGNGTIVRATVVEFY